MHGIATIRKSYHINFKWAWNASELELLALITSNKNGRKSNKNLKAMIGATRAQFPK
jgi:hypothetical protein